MKIQYGYGAMAVFFIFFGLGIILLSLGIIQILNFISIILTPLGIYTLIYGFIVKEDFLYYSSWGIVLFSIGLIFLLYNVISPLIIIGLVIIIIAIASFVVYIVKKK